MPRPLANLDLDLVRSFVTIANLGNFTRAAERLGRQQSTISLQVQRLEDVLGRRLLDRSPRAVTLTPDGEAFLESAQRLLDLNDEIVARASEPTMRGLVRLGTPEDFATSHLQGVLARFAQAYPAIALEVTCDLTLNLMARFRTGDFDIALVKREPLPETETAGPRDRRGISPDVAGVRVWREPLVWVSGDRDFWHAAGPLPLVVSPAPCVYRQRAIDTLDRAGRSWRISYTCGSLAGSLAAVKAGLGMTVLPKDMAPPDLHIFDAAPLPDLMDTEIALLTTPTLTEPATRLRDHIVRSLERRI